jgi:hypothetical protein
VYKIILIFVTFMIYLFIYNLLIMLDIYIRTPVRIEIPFRTTPFLPINLP